MGGEELKWRQLAQHQLLSPHGPHFSPHSTAKANDKSTNLRKIINDTSDVVITSVHSEKTCLKKMIMIITMNKSKNDGFWRAPEIDFCYETKRW